MTKLNPYIRFNDGKCLEAMRYYKNCLGGRLSYSKVGKSPMSSDFPEDKQDLIMHGELRGEDFVFYGSDMLRDKAIVGDHMGMSIECESEDELRAHYDKLSKDATDIMSPPKKEFWGGVYAMFTDKYGVEWMLNYQENPIPEDMMEKE